MDTNEVLELVNGKFRQERHRAIRTYVIFAVLGFISSSVVVFAAVQLTDFTNGEVLTAQAINGKFNVIVENIERLETQIGGSATSSETLTGTVMIDQNTNSVIGSGTQFTTELRVGDAISILGEVHSVASIEGPSNLTLDAVHTAGASAEVAYTDTDLLSVKSSAGKDKLVVDKSGNVIANGINIRRIERATGLGPNVGEVNGIVLDRTLNISKLLDESTLRIAYSDSFGINNTQGGCRWEIFIDNSPCPDTPLVYDISSTVNIFRSTSVFGYCKVAAGSHTITVQNYPVPGNTAVGQCHTGWSDSRWTLEAEEVM